MCKLCMCQKVKLVVIVVGGSGVQVLQFILHSVQYVHFEML